MRPFAIITSDIHIREDRPICRTDDYLETQKMKLEYLKLKAKEYSCIVLDAGDLLHKYKISPYMESFAIQSLPDNFFTVPGNHDLPYNNIKDLMKSSLYLLQTAKALTVLTEPKKFIYNNCSVLVYPFPFSFSGDLSYSKEIYQECDFKIAITHAYVQNPDKLKDVHYSFDIPFLEKSLPDFDLIISGHNHDSFQHGKVLNPGSMMRMFADQKEYQPGFFLLYLVKGGKIEIRKEFYPFKEGVVSREHLEKKEAINEKLSSFISGLKNQYEKGLSFKENIENYLLKNKENSDNINDDVIKRVMEAIENE